jgi:hypothetical protein
MFSFHEEQQGNEILSMLRSISRGAAGASVVPMRRAEFPETSSLDLDRWAGFR